MQTSIVRSLIRGQSAARPLFIPLIFSLAAKVEDIPLSTFMRNPTKIANALTAIHRQLNTDGVVGYFDLSLVAEALGCQLSWDTLPPAITPPQKETFFASMQLSPQELKGKGRIPVALEVIQRLTITLRNGPALLVGLPGPLRLATQLFGQDFVTHLAADEDEAVDSFALLIELLRHLAQDFSLAGTHILLIDEETVPAELWERWEAATESNWNAIRFHNTLPVLRTGSFVPPGPIAGNPLPCIVPWPNHTLPIPALPFALALPLQETLPAGISSWTDAKQCVLLTTDGEIPYQSEIQTLPRRIALLRSTLVGNA
jgi:Uroporphyrinogen decarboxylase (URO-D)